jgi:hypothetical protein
MPSWTEVAGFCFAALVVPVILLHLWALIYPNGKIGERLHPPSIDSEERGFILRRIWSLEEIALQGQRVPPCQLNPFEDAELVTTVRRSPRRRRANNAIDGPQEPGL